MTAAESSAGKTVPAPGERIAYRTDINGLRAYAVLAVMLFHFGVRAVSGGFIGVDVFFVISGFLMTGLIMAGIDKRAFSVGKFYLERARRIIPALAVLCIVLLAAGWFWLAPHDYRLLGSHTAAAVSFTSNFTFKDEDGYFDAPSKTKWLLHTWSLAVEWQFYVLYPLLLAGFAHFISRNRTHLQALLWAIGAASLALCVFITHRDSAFAFYLLPARAWELIAGGLVFLYAPQVRLPALWSRAFELAGLALIILSAVLFDGEMDWPGLPTVLPIAGSVLVLLAARQKSIWTANPAAASIGRWSYSIYLWHWPIVVALGYFSLGASLFWCVIGFAASIALGAVSFVLVEQPARRFFTERRWRQATLAAFASIALVAVAGEVVAKKGGLPARVSPLVAKIDAESSNYFKGAPKHCGFDAKHLTYTPCIIGDAQNVKWVVWGDSHAGAIVGAVRALTPGGILYSMQHCPTVFNSETKSRGDDRHCTDYNRLVFGAVQKLPPDVGVIILNRYSVSVAGPNESKTKRWGLTYTDLGPEQATEDVAALYQKRLVATLCTIAKSRPVYAVAPIPEMGVDVPKTMVNALMTGRHISEISIPRAAYLARNRVALAALNEAAQTCGVHVLDPTPYLCDADKCYGAKADEPYYFDDDHLSETGNRLLLPMFEQIMH